MVNDALRYLDLLTTLEGTLLLLGILIVAAFEAIYLWLKRDEKLLQKVPPEQAADLAVAIADRIKVDIGAIPESKRVPVVLAELALRAKAQNHRTLIVIVFGVLAVFLFSIVVLNPRQAAVEQWKQEINRLKNATAGQLRARHETFRADETVKLARVTFDLAQKLIREYGLVDDSQLSDGYVIDKYQYLSYAQMIAADAARHLKDKSTATRIARDGERSARFSLEKMEVALNVPNSKLSHEIREFQDVERTSYLLALLLAIEDLSVGSNENLAEIIGLWCSIPLVQRESLEISEPSYLIEAMVAGKCL